MTKSSKQRWHLTKHGSGKVLVCSGSRKITISSVKLKRILNSVFADRVKLKRILNSVFASEFTEHLFKRIKEEAER